MTKFCCLVYCWQSLHLSLPLPLLFSPFPPLSSSFSSSSSSLATLASLLPISTCGLLSYLWEFVAPAWITSLSPRGSFTSLRSLFKCYLFTKTFSGHPVQHFTHITPIIISSPRFIYFFSPLAFIIIHHSFYSHYLSQSVSRTGLLSTMSTGIFAPFVRCGILSVRTVLSPSKCSQKYLLSESMNQ